MISFNSTNLKVKLITSDNIGGVNEEETHIDNSMLNYIFENYLYYKLDETVSDILIKYSYALKYSMIETMLADDNLTNSIKVFLTYYMLLARLNSGEIYILANLKNPEFITLVFSNITNELSLGTFVDTEYNTSIMGNSVHSVDNLQIRNIVPHSTDNFLLYMTETVQYSKCNLFLKHESVEDCPQNDDIILLVEKDSLTAEEYDAIVTDPEFTAIVPADYIAKMNMYNGFVFEFNFNGYIQTLLLASSGDSYRLSNELNSIFIEVDDHLPDQVFTFERRTYITIIEDTVSQYDDSPNPYVRWDKKFIFQHLQENDKPIYIEEDNLNPPYEICINEYDDNFTFNTSDNLLTEYLASEYNSDSTIVTDSGDWAIFIEKYNVNVKKIKNSLTKQYEFWDMHDDLINGTIGSINDAEYINIQGFDSTSLDPILLYISKEFDISGFMNRTYRITQGGIKPINNDNLSHQYSSDTFIQNYTITTIDFAGDLLRYDQLSNYTWGTTLNLDDNFLYDPITISGDYKLFIDTDEISTPDDISYYAYKHPDKPILISNEKYNINLMPFQVLIAMDGITDDSSAIEAVNNILYKNSEDIDTSIMKYDSLYFTYFSFISFNSYYLFNDVISNNLNLILNDIFLSKLYNQIKQSQLTSIYEDSTITDYTFSLVNDLCTIDTTNYGDLSSLITMITDVVSTTIYDTDDTNVCALDEIMSLLIGEDLYSVNISDTEDTFILSTYLAQTVMATSNNFIIFNKVIGVDLYAYYSLYSDEFDITFSDYFINTFNDFNGLLFLLDLDNAKISNISTNSLEFTSSINNPITVSPDVLYDKNLYQFNKSDYDLVLDVYKKYMHIYELTINVEYSFCSIDKINDLIVNPNIDDICMHI